MSIGTECHMSIGTECSKQW